MKVHFTLSPTELAHVKEVYDCQTEDSLMMKRQNVCPRNKTGVSSRLPPAANNQTFFFPSLFRSNFLCFDVDYFSRRKKYYIFYEDLLTFLRMKI